MFVGPWWRKIVDLEQKSSTAKGYWTCVKTELRPTMGKAVTFREHGSENLRNKCVTVKGKSVPVLHAPDALPQGKEPLISIG
jgi:hypothetical protein